MHTVFWQFWFSVSYLNNYENTWKVNLLTIEAYRLNFKGLHQDLGKNMVVLNVIQVYNIPSFVSIR